MVNPMARTWAAVIFLLVVVVALGACRTPPPRTGGQAADDEAVTAEVRARLLKDPATRGLAIDVQTVGGVVTLTGTVDTEREGDKAALIASGVGGCRKVNNLTTVKK